MKSFLLPVIFLTLSCSGEDKDRKMEYTLAETPHLSGSCGIWSFCLGMKFQKSDNTSFVGLINCPEFFSKDFFKAGNKYIITFKNDQLKRVCELTQNEYEEENLPIYLVDQISLK